MKFCSKIVCILVIIALIFLFFVKCQSYELKDIISNNSKISSVDSFESIYACNDIATIKSQVDLKILSYINSCYLCTSIKSVPGFGSINWTSNCETFKQDSFLKIEFRTYEKDLFQYYDREKITILNVPKRVGKFNLYNTFKNSNNGQVPWSNYFRLLADGDLVDASWEIDTLCMNYLNIQQINLEDKYITGEFEVHYKIKNKGGNVVYSDRINFIKSNFQSNIF